MDVIDDESFIALVETYDCIWKNKTINADNLSEVESAWVSIAYSIYENFEDIKVNQKRFWVNNLKRKWKIILNKFNNLGSEYDKFENLKFLLESKSVAHAEISQLKLKNFPNIVSENTKIPSSSTAEPLKCGEILLDNGKFIYQCAICSHSLFSIESFDMHLSKTHLPSLLNDVKTDKIYEVIPNENIEYLIDEECTESKVEINSETNNTENNQNFPSKKSVIHIQNDKIESNENVAGYEQIIIQDEIQAVNSYKEIYLDKIECPHCNFMFLSTQDHDFDNCLNVQNKIFKLNGDLRALRDEGIFHCDRCPRYFETANDMHNHRREEHYQICPVCKIRLLHVENHIIAHHNEIDYNKLKVPESFKLGTFQCRLCDQMFVNKDMWMYHKAVCSNPNFSENKIKKFRFN